MTIKVDQDKCLGCGRCTEICPNVFNLSNDGKAEVVSTEDLECAQKAADQCPTEAIIADE